MAPRRPQDDCRSRGTASSRKPGSNQGEEAVASLGQPDGSRTFDSRSRKATGAVRWLKPTNTMVKSKPRPSVQRLPEDRQNDRPADRHKTALQRGSRRCFHMPAPGILHTLR